MYPMIAPPDTDDPAVRPLLVLHLEDSMADQRLAAVTLRRAGMDCRITCVDALSDFIAQLQNTPFDLILADYHLPGFTALHAWQAAQNLPRCPPCVLLSGAIGETAAVQALHLGISDYLLKEDIHRLPHVLQRALEITQAREAREQAMRELAISQRHLSELTEHLQQSIEQERASIAREIHDDIGGSLTSIKFDVAWLLRNTDSEEQKTHARAALEMLQHALGASQRIMLNLRPPVLDQGLVAAVQWLAENFERRTGITSVVHTSSQYIDVPAELQVVAYRTAQEALTNISKYAQASAVHIDLSDHEGFLTLEVRDNGQGLDPEARDKPKAFGLRGLAERARTVQGWLDISSRKGQGTSIIVTIPLPLPASSNLGGRP